MKKLLFVFMIFAILLVLSACSNTTSNNDTSAELQQTEAANSATDKEAENQNSEQEPTETGSKSLVVYFSWSGNTRSVAESIASRTNSDVFEIVPAEPYSDDYNAVVDLAQEEQKNNVRPEIVGSIDDIEQYDVVYVGYPNWWGDMPMVLYTFFDTYDLSGKTVAPFCTSGGSGLSNTVNEIKELEPNATVTEGLHIGSGSASNPDNAVNEWLAEIA